MDFLVLLIFYCFVFVVGCLCLLYRDAAVFCTGPIGTLRNLTANVTYTVVPQRVQDVLYSMSQYLFYTRTCAFQILFIILCILAHAVWVVDMLPLLFQNYPQQNHTFWPLTAVFINYVCFHLAWTGDPGEITQRNHGNYMKVYQHDEQLFKSDVMCSTCKLVKPARSKHCNICNRCVHRFDHHCIWTNNCVGGLNHRFFILFMVTLILMFLQGIYVGSGCIRDYADSIRLYNASYIDEYNKVRPVTVSIAFQHLFMQLPRLVFLVIACVVLTVLVGVFLCQHLYLMFINQTTNEMYKKSDLVWQSNMADSQPGCNGEDCKSDKLKRKTRSKISRGETANKQEQERRTKITSSYRPYSRGIFNNFMEVFFPHNFLQKRIYNDK